MKPTKYWVAMAATFVALAACGPAHSAGQALPMEQAQPAEPINNCGVTLPATGAPERIMTMKSSTAELVEAFGLGDRLVAAAALDAPLSGHHVIEGVPSYEAVLELAPDLIFAGWESNVSEQGAGGRERLHQAGITTYVAPAACQDPQYRPDPMTFDLLFEQMVEAGDVLGAPEAAASLVRSQQAELAQIQPDAREFTALWYSSGTDTPFIGGGIGVPQMLMAAAGLENIAADQPEPWISMSWEEVVNREPEVIILVDSQWNTAANKAQRLRTDPLLQSLPAVQEERFLVVDFPATEAGVQNVAAVAQLVEQLAGIP